MTGRKPSPDFMRRHRLQEVINAAGTMTALGASRVVPEAVRAGAEIQDRFLRVDDLQARASAVVARLTGAEAGCVTACTAAGMTLSAAACMTGSDLARIERLPDTDGLRNRVLVQAGHLVHYGAPVEQAIRASGAVAIPVGTAARAETYHLRDRICEDTCAALYVVSHHVVQEGQIGLSAFADVCREAGIPVIVDMASEYDLTGPVALGCDLVLYSAHKFLGGPTAGIVAGRKELVRACYLQNRGLGRLMKVGKEGIAGTVAALEAWERRDHAAARRREREIAAGWLESLAHAPGVEVSLCPDWTGNPIDRVRLAVDPREAGIYAWELADALGRGTPPVVVRDDLVEHGHVFLDPCNLDSDEARVVSDAILDVLRRVAEVPLARRYGLAERRERGAAAALAWPDGGEGEDARE